MSPFEVFHGHKPSQPLDLIPISPHASLSDSAEAFVQLHNLHIEINQVEASNSSYKLRVDVISNTLNVILGLCYDSN